MGTGDYGVSAQALAHTAVLCDSFTIIQIIFVFLMIDKLD